ncbi:MAG: tRNA (adenosine(37)-N6)-dimethylallyltransferase MiaA [Planctomycetota bacterium]
MSLSLLCLTGPTASGKEAAALPLAASLGAEIVSADSMKIYRGMDVGTAKASTADRARVPHHLVDVADPSEAWSAGRYVKEADGAILEVASRARVPLVTGGTPMWIKGLLEGIFEGPAADWAVRGELMDRAEREGAPALHGELAAVDPAAARKIHPNDVRRIVRALEVHRLTGKPISEMQAEWGKRRSEYRTLLLCLRRDREDLCRRVDARVDRMFATGLVDEVKRLLAAPGGLGRGARQALGYCEVIEHLEGKRGLAETIDLVKRETRRFAKRQMTWFRSLGGLVWVDVAADEPPARTAERLEELAVRFLDEDDEETDGLDWAI